MSVVKMERVLLTPEMAAGFLAGSKFKNRSVNKGNVARFAEDIIAGRWKETGDCIRIGPSGMIDGQHRCLAVVKAGLEIVTWVATVDSDAIYDVLDTGGLRDRGDVLDPYTKHSKQAAAIVNAVYAIELRAVVPTAHSFPSNARSTNAEALERYLQDREAFDQAVDAGVAAARALKGCGFAAPGAMFFVYRNATWLSSFFDGVLTGVGLSKGSPELALRNRIITDAARRQPTTGPMKVAYWMSAAQHRSADAHVSRLLVRSFPYPSTSTLRYRHKP